MKNINMIFVFMFLLLGFYNYTSAQTVDLSLVGTSPISEDGGSIVVRATLSGLTPDANVTVQINWTGATGDVTGESDITILNGQTTGDVTILSSADTFLEGDETVTATISGYVYAGAGGPITNGTTTSVNFSIIDAEYIELLTSANPISETGGSTNYTARVSGGGTNETGGTITVNIDWTGGTATPTTDFTGHLASTSIANSSSSSANILVSAAHDTDNEGNETIGASIASLSGAPVGTGYVGGTVSTTITDDDAHVVVSLVAPSNENTDQNKFSNVLFDWSASAGSPNFYQLQVSETNTFATTVLETYVTFPTSQFSADLSSLDFLKTYYWRVRSTENMPVGAGSVGNWSSTWSFTTQDNYKVTLMTPANNSENIVHSSAYFSWQAKDIIVNWDKLLGLKYNLIYSTNSDLSAATTVSNISSAFQYQGLATGRTYYWKVETVKSGVVVAESDKYSFTTDGAVVKPEIVYPKDETTVYSINPIGYWYTTGFNTVHKYEVEFAPVGTPLSSDGTDYASITNTKVENLPALFSVLSSLTGGETYHWHVRSVVDVPLGTDIVSDWSDTERFVVFNQADASIPNPAFPTGGVELYSKFPVLYWTLAGPSQGLLYNVQYDTDANFTASPITLENISITNVTLFNNINSGQTYFWRVQSKVGVAGTPSAWSSTGTFKIYNFEQDLKPIQSWPIGGNQVYSTTANFAWHVNGPSLGLSYKLQYSNDASDVALAVLGSNGSSKGEVNSTSNLLEVENLTPGETYYWAVRVNNSANATNWSTVESFTIISANGSPVPVLNWPTGGTVIFSTNQDLSWSLIGGTAAEFDVEVYTDASLTTHFTGSPFDNVTSPHSLTGLTAGATYYWRAQVDGETLWSNVEAFTVFSGAAPTVPIAASPAGGVEINSSSATLSWFLPSEMESTPSYEVEYANNASFANSTKVSGLSNPNYLLNRLPAGTYYWRSRTQNEDGKYSSYSSTSDFVVTGVTSVEIEEPISNNFELEQNYPNPFNPSTAIKYNLPQSSFVSLRIYNMLGQEVRTLVNEQSNAGLYTMTWNGKDNYGNSVSSGAYIYQIVAGNFVQTKKMILLK